MVDHGVLDLHGLFLLDAALSLASGVMLLGLYQEVRPVVIPLGGVVALALRAVRQVATTRTTLVLFGVYGLLILAQQVANPFLPLLVQHLHRSPVGLATTIGLIFGVASLTGAFLSPLAGLLGDRYGYRRILIVAALVGAVGLTGLALAPTLVWLTVAAILFGGAGASGASMVYALLATAVPEDRRTTTLNLAYVPLYVAGILGGSLGALLVRGGLNAVMLAGAVCALLAAFLTYRLTVQVIP